MTRSDQTSLVKGECAWRNLADEKKIYFLFRMLRWFRQQVTRKFEKYIVFGFMLKQIEFNLIKLKLKLKS